MENSKIKIAVFIRGFHNGGIEKVFESYFAHMDLSPFEIHIVTHRENLPEKVAYFERLGCTIHELHRVHGHKITRQNFEEYERLFSTYKFDVVHNNMPENLLPLRFAKKLGVQVRILHAHSDYMSGLENKNAVLVAGYKAGYKLNASRATHLIACSEVAGASAFGTSSKGKVVIVPNAIDTSAFVFDESKRETFRDMLGISDSFCVGHVGRYENDLKNQEFVLEVFDAFKRNFPKSVLLMVGGGKRLPEYKEKASEMGLDGSVIFTDAVSDVSGYLQAMDAFVLPSRKEGLGISAIEAQAAGLYCLVSDCVPPEVQVTPNVSFLPINQGVECWVERLNMLQDFSRCDMRDAVVRAGYEIRNQASLMENLYLGK